MRVQFDTDEMRATAEQELAAAQAKYAESMEIIQKIESIGESLSLFDAPESAPNNGWRGVRPAVLEAVAALREVSPSTAMEFVAQRYPGAEVELTQVSAALRRLLHHGKVSRTREASHGREPEYQLVR